MTTYQRGDVLIKTLPQRISDGTYRGLVLVSSHSGEQPFGDRYTCDVPRSAADEALQDADAYLEKIHPGLVHRNVRTLR